MRKFPWRRKWQSTLIFLPGKSYGQRSLADYSPWDCKESDMIEQLTHYWHSQFYRMWTCEFVVVQVLSPVRLFATPWTTACRACLSFTISWSLLKLMSIESVMPSNHLVLCHPLLLLPSIFPSIRVFSNELALCIRWPKYWSLSFSISLSNIK